MAPGLRIGLGKRGDGGDHARIVDQHVKLAKGRMTGLDRRGHLPEAACVAGDGNGARPDFARQIGNRIAITRNKRHIRARLRKDPRGNGPDSPARAGDENAFSGHAHDAPLSPPCASPILSGTMGEFQPDRDLTPSHAGPKLRRRF